MDLMDTVSSALGGGNTQGNIVSTIMELIGGQSGGLNGLIQQFTKGGLGDVISSWVGTGNNQPISADQVHSVLGSDTIKNLSSKLGIDTNNLTGQLSNLLPQIVDKLTPKGKVPEGDIISQGKNLLGGLLGQ
jgi:uncharacterized protein YidB (DUF937 family)